MKLRRTACLWLPAAAALVALAYLLTCLFISVELGRQVAEANEGRGESELRYGYTDEDIAGIAVRDGADLSDYTRKARRTPVLAVSWLTGGRAVFWYWSELKLDGELRSGSWRVPVVLTYEMRGLRPVVTDVYEHT